jgi:hypothetical protein
LGHDLVCDVDARVIPLIVTGLEDYRYQLGRYMDAEGPSEVEALDAVDHGRGLASGERRQFVLLLPNLF